ncbi:hypothetical protein [Lichenihabitans psoromatis]|uniref:hypothetical protein n=1 Tax=Lichenihabitans psoromatis TaxID=2528642 RepID=UPI00103838C6|nr:hypothetical protein [Lichenihabitans psoromatis]
MNIRRISGSKMMIDETSIEVDPRAFIDRAKLEHKEIEGNYRTRKWRIVEKCAIAVTHARKHPEFRKFVKDSDFWKNSRQKPAKDSADWCTKYILNPTTTKEKATAGRYAAVIEYLLSKKVKPEHVAAQLKKRGGIDKVYAKSTGRKRDDEGAELSPQRNYDKDDFHAKWTDEQRDQICDEPGEKTIKIRVIGRLGEFKQATIIDVC